MSPDAVDAAFRTIAGTRRMADFAQRRERDLLRMRAKTGTFFPARRIST